MSDECQTCCDLSAEIWRLLDKVTKLQDVDSQEVGHLRAQVTELQRANNREVEKRRRIEQRFEESSIELNDWRSGLRRINF